MPSWLFLVDNFLSTVMQFYIAGTDTTSSQLYWFYLFAGLYPEVQEKMYQEIKEVLGEHMQLCIKKYEIGTSKPQIQLNQHYCRSIRDPMIIINDAC